MGARLQAEVERQLLNDLAYHGRAPDGLTIDWSAACQEGHMTTVLGGELEELSGIRARDQAGGLVADGWMDFIHGGNEHPLFVFWLFLALYTPEGSREVKREPTIPEHVWARLPETSKKACATTGTYDTRWSNDPLVLRWKRQDA